MDNFWSRGITTLRNLILSKKWSWSSIGSVLLVISLFNYWLFGFKFLIGLFIGIIAFLIGVSFKIYTIYMNNPFSNLNSRIFMKYKLCKNKNNEKNSPTRNKLDMRLTGSAIIDETLHEMIDYIIRDYIHDWYDFISEDDDFVHELRKAIQEAIVNLSSRIKEVDWIPFLTTNLVDDGASHLRLYRTALTKIKENPNNNDLISVFFDLEAKMEKNFCRDMVSIDDTHLKDYLQGITEAILYLVLPQDSYNCSSIGLIAQDLLVNYVLIPVLDIISDPDFINQTIIWLCQSSAVVTNETFLNVIRTTSSTGEINSAQDFLLTQTDELKNILSSQSHEELKKSAIQQLRTVSYMRKALEIRHLQLKEGKKLGDWAIDDDFDQWQNYIMTPGMKFVHLTLEQILKESVALSYFLDYMGSVGGNNYLLLYLNAEAWKSSSSQQLLEIQNNQNNPQINNTTSNREQNLKAMIECLRTAALNIYDQFLSEKAISPKVKLAENVVKRFYIQSKNEAITIELFDEIQGEIYKIIESTEKFYPDFLKHKLYIKLLFELDLLKSESVSPNDDDECSDDEDVLSLVIDSDYDNGSLNEFQNKIDKIDEFQYCRECLKLRRQMQGMDDEEIKIWEKIAWDKKYRLSVEIIETAISTEKGSAYGVYAVSVSRIEMSSNHAIGTEKKWHIYRRYSDFYDFHNWIKSKWMRLSKLDFPSKHTFNKTDRQFLEKRMNGLNKYLASIISLTSSEPCYGDSLQDSLLHFLEPGKYIFKRKQFAEKIDTLVNPLKQSVKSVTHTLKSVPENLYNTVDGFTKLFHSKNVLNEQFAETLKVGSSIDTETDDNIPLRIILLLMDEVFDIKTRNQWLRRRIIAIVREILKAMMGDIVNRRIIDYVAYITSPVKMSSYLRNLQSTLWPNGKKISAGIPRDNDTKMRTRIAAKASLFASLSDELKHLIGSETTRRGLLCVFELCQNQVLNRRLLLVIFEGIIKTLYPDKPFGVIIQRLHYRSNRVSKSRPFLISSMSNTNLKISSSTSSNLSPKTSPRGSRKKK